MPATIAGESEQRVPASIEVVRAVFGELMPRFFFDTFDGTRFVPDEDGLELDNIETAKAEAQKALPDLARDGLPDGNHNTFVVSVRDEEGKVVLRAALSLVTEDGTLDD